MVRGRFVLGSGERGGVGGARVGWMGMGPRRNGACGLWTDRTGREAVRSWALARQAGKAGKAGGEAREERTGTGTGTGTCLDGGPRGVCKVEKRTPARKRGCGVPAALYWELHLGRPSRRIPAWQYEFFFFSCLAHSCGLRLARPRAHRHRRERDRERVCVCARECLAAQVYGASSPVRACVLVSAGGVSWRHPGVYQNEQETGRRAFRLGKRRGGRDRRKVGVPPEYGVPVHAWAAAICQACICTEIQVLDQWGRPSGHRHGQGVHHPRQPRTALFAHNAAASLAYEYMERDGQSRACPPPI